VRLTVEEQSPVLAFDAWVTAHVQATGKKLTQDEYFLAQAAFYAAHPGNGPAFTLTAGYCCAILDSHHDRGAAQDGLLWKIGVDVREYRPNMEASIVFAFPPCTNLAVSGARWFEDKGLEALHDSLGVVLACKRICEASGAPWMLENPVGTLSSYWRKPDYTFQPWQYGDTYTKKTCLWTGNGFVMPEPWIAHKPADVKASIHLMPPSADRGDKRSVTPEGFARAVFAVNEPLVRSRVA
jgi:hypothetical protein